ncbi:hypothetical protein Tco_0749443 [Tanacetum coccineum]|uniref:Uncharacterized protein n=1 Tax=Tanacetum coccineum TaxID=301880 RepID=A0ABQ4Z1I0_9ASTR
MQRLSMEVSTIRFVVEFPTEAGLATIKSKDPSLEATLSVATREVTSKKSRWKATSKSSSNKERHKTSLNTSGNPWAHLTWPQSSFTNNTKEKCTCNKPNTYLIPVSSHGLLASNMILDTVPTDEITLKESHMKAILRTTFKKRKRSQGKGYTKDERANDLQQPNDKRSEGLNFTLTEKVRGLLMRDNC